MKHRKIKVIGDIMLDIWCDGKYEQKSAEVPINIFQTRKINFSLGGVGNLCVNLSSLKIKYDLFSEIGNDHYASKIFDILKKEKINFKPINSKKITTLKERFFYKDKQIFRRDIENNILNNRLTKIFIKKEKKNDIILISDYKKGSVDKSLLIELKKKNCVVFVDPKNKPEYFKDAFLVKPNMEKFEEWCGKFSEKKAFNLIRKMNWHWLVVSNNKNGIYVFNKHGQKNFYRVGSVKEPNVIGAGDILFSGIIYNYLNSLDIFTSVELASYATTQCVSKKKIRKIIKNDFKKNTVFTNGVFDILHKGHIDLLKFAKKIGKKLIIGINSDKSVKINKGPNRPFNNLKNRIKELKKTNLFDKIITFNEKTPIKLISRIKPDVIVKGDDYSFSKIAGNKISNIILFKKKNNLSSSKLISSIKIHR